MKKYILLLAGAAFITSCQKIQAGGNKDAMKTTEDIVRYSDANAPKPTYVAQPDSAKIVTELQEVGGSSMKSDSSSVAKPVETK